MPALNFPTSPALNDVYTANGTTWKWNGVSWLAITVIDATNVSGVLPLANGGTGGTTDAEARASLGATTIGSNLFTLADPAAVTFPRFNADNSISTLDATTFRTAIGAGTSR